MPRPARILGAVTVDDTSTLFELCITHALLLHVDHVLVLDQSSSPAVAAGLARLATAWGDRLTRVRAPGQQRPVETLREHSDRAAADWISWFAADEFGLVAAGSSLRQLLADVPPAHVAVRCHVDHWVSMQDFDAPEAVRVGDLRFRAQANLFVADEAGVLADEVAHGTVNAFDMPPPPRLIVRAAAADLAVAAPSWPLAAAHYRVARVPLPDRRALELRCRGCPSDAAPADPAASAWFQAVFASVARRGELDAFWDRHSLSCVATGMAGSRPRVVRDDALAEGLVAAVARLVGPVQEDRSWGGRDDRHVGAGPAPRLAAAVGTILDLEDRLERSEWQRDGAVQERITAVAARVAAESHRDAIAAHRDAIVIHRDAVLARRDALIRERDRVVVERDAAVAQLATAIQERDRAIEHRDQLLRERDVRERARISPGPPVAFPAVGAATGGPVEVVHPMKPKVFGVGWAKTGTTTLGRCYEILGLDHQGPDLALVKDLREGDLGRIMALARRRQAFEDWPWPVVYRELDEAFPGSRFILTVRSPARWLQSYRGMLAAEGPASDELNEVRSILYGLDFPDVRDADLVARYNRHNADVRRYFADRPGCLLVVDWEVGSGWRELCGFLGCAPPRVPFPHANRGRHAAAAFMPPS